MEQAHTPPLHGFLSDGEAVSGNESSTSAPGESGVRTRRSYAEKGETFVPSHLTSSRKKSFRPRSNTDPLATVPEDAVLSKQPSLDWDGFGEPEPVVGSGHDNTRRWSTDTLYSATQPSRQRRDTGSYFAGSESESSEGDDFLSPEEQDIGNMAEDVATLRKKVDKAIMEAKEDVLPFQGKPVTTECLNRLCSLAGSLKRELQRLHLELVDDDIYKQAKEESAQNCRTRLTEFLIQAEATKTQSAEQERIRKEELAASAPDTAKRPIILKQTGSIREELVLVIKAVKELASGSPQTDVEVFEKAEMLKVLENRQLSALEDGKEVLRLAMDNNMMEQWTMLDGVMNECKKVIPEAKKTLLEWRKLTGVWSEKKSRTGARQDLKLPTFSPGITSKLTVYEFEKEWGDYCEAMEYSREERLKNLKLAIQQPARGDVASFQTEGQVMDYLKKHYGNPMVLLNAREQEIRAWPACRGTDVQQREWLIQAKTKLEATVRMCKDHDIEKYLHFSGVAGEIQGKLSPEMVKDYKTLLKKHLSPSGVLEKEKIVELMLDFLEDKILDCTLGVNLEISNFLGSSKPQEQKSESNKPQYQRPQRAHHAAKSQSGQQRAQDGKKTTFQLDNKCRSCSEHHSHLFYCEAFIAANPADRFDLVRRQKACARCLSMKVKLAGKKSDWFPLHEKYCKTDFACEEGDCQGKQKDSQFHIVVCRHHTTENKSNESAFIASLDQKLLPSSTSGMNIRFLYMVPMQALHVSNESDRPKQPLLERPGGGHYEIIPDVTEAAVFMMQWLPSAGGKGQQLLAFYDSGCSGAGLSDRAVKLLETREVRPGPTTLDVAGGRSIEIPHGDVQFNLELEGGRQLATITALHMPDITSPFPLVKLAEAWLELQREAQRCSTGWQLPPVDEELGGAAVMFSSESSI